MTHYLRAFVALIAEAVGCVPVVVARCSLMPNRVRLGSDAGRGAWACDSSSATRGRPRKADKKRRGEREK